MGPTLQGAGIPTNEGQGRGSHHGLKSELKGQSPGIPKDHSPRQMQVTTTIGREGGMEDGILGMTKVRSDLQLARASPLRGLVSGTTSGDMWLPLWGATGYPTMREGTPELPFLRGDGGGMGTRRDRVCSLELDIIYHPSCQ